MRKILKLTFLWFCIITAAASIIGGLILLDIPLYIQLLIIAFLAFFAFDAITEYKKRKNNDEVIES